MIDYFFESEADEEEYMEMFEWPQFRTLKLSEDKKTRKYIDRYGRVICDIKKNINQYIGGEIDTYH
ncbi:MAG: hypothetical protein WC781_00035 [Candidatus Pacearchaeota archaeon]|jgi:hypothetical protein